MAVVHMQEIYTGSYQLVSNITAMEFFFKPHSNVLVDDIKKVPRWKLAVLLGKYCGDGILEDNAHLEVSAPYGCLLLAPAEGLWPSAKTGALWAPSWWPLAT